MALRLKEVVTAGLWLLLAMATIYTFCGCTVEMAERGAVGFRITTGMVGLEFYHEATDTGDAASVSLDVDKGLKTWMWDDKENEQSLEDPELPDLPPLDPE